MVQPEADLLYIPASYPLMPLTQIYQADLAKSASRSTSRLWTLPPGWLSEWRPVQRAVRQRRQPGQLFARDPTGASPAWSPAKNNSTKAISGRSRRGRRHRNRRDGRNSCMHRS